MKKYIIIINGTGGAGKDEFVKYTKKYAKVVNFSSIDKVKEIARYIGWDGAKTEKDRKFLSDLKRLTTEYNDMSFDSIKKAVKEFYESDNEIIFIHIREPEEIARASKAFEADDLLIKTLLVKRVGLNNIMSNSSDASVDNYDYDYIIENSTLEKLDQDAKRLVDDLLKK